MINSQWSKHVDDFSTLDTPLQHLLFNLEYVSCGFHFSMFHVL